jgi:segregation and condensation protein B
MSLKAKIEAVIYASEEPVTLAQLTGLLGEEAQAELNALDTQQQTLALDDLSIPDQDALNAETLESSEEEQAPDPSIPEPGAPGPDSGTWGEPATEPGLELQTTPTPDPKAEALAAKQRERRLREYFRSLLDQLIRDYASDSRGLEIREVAGGFRLATKPEYHDAVRGFVKSLKPPLKLSLQALETLAVVAYKQPATAPEVSEIRGVDSAGVLGSLLARKLVTTAGRKPVIGRPILYKTTKDFLLRFGLKDISELPSIEEFEKMAGELNAQEEIPMEESLSASHGRRTDAETNVSAGGSSSSLDEWNAVPEPTHIHHETLEDLMSDKSIHPEGHKREPASRHQVELQTHQIESQTGAEQPSDQGSQLRAEDEAATENEANEVVIDGRLSGLSPDYSDDSPSAEEAREQEQEERDEP